MQNLLSITITSQDNLHHGVELAVQKNYVSPFGSFCFSLKQKT